MATPRPYPTLATQNFMIFSSRFHASSTSLYASYSSALKIKIQILLLAKDMQTQMEAADPHISINLAPQST